MRFMTQPQGELDLERWTRNPLVLAVRESVCLVASRQPNRALAFRRQNLTTIG